jgi:hypothetical protein
LCNLFFFHSLPEWAKIYNCNHRLCHLYINYRVGTFKSVLWR